MSESTNTTTPPAAKPPAISKSTLPITGLQVDIYGLSELPKTATSITCLWLHHQRLKTKEDMGRVAEEMISTYNNNNKHISSAPSRGLIAVAFDQRNHGTRLVSEVANEAWRQGNKTHAQDMLGTISGTVVDTMLLLDALEGYLFGAGHGPGAAAQERRRIDSNIVLGVSLGGHSAWQLLWADPRVTAGVIVIGCPDYMNLMQDRARLSKLQTYLSDSGASFLGSKDFPSALLGLCDKYDPKGILFSTGTIPGRPSPSEQEKYRTIMDARIRGKKFQILSGGADKLVPYQAGKQFLDFFKDAVGGWYKDGNVHVEDNVYPGVGHTFTAEMLRDAVRFVLDTVKSFDAPGQLPSPRI